MATVNSSSMSMTVGRVPEFNPNEGDWNTYIEQLELFLKQIEFCFKFNSRARNVDRIL